MRISQVVAIAIMTLTASAAFLIPTAYSGPYRDYDALMSNFKTLADSHPNLVTFETIGKTVQGKDIMMVKIGNPSCDSILLDGAIHGWETLGSELLCFFTKWLLTSSDPLAGQILAESYILMVPGVNVDGFNVWRTNANGVDLNRNFATNWDHGGSSDPTSQDYRGTAPLSEPESQALVRIFEKYKPRFYLNLHFGPGGSQYYFGSSYGNHTYYSIITSRIQSLWQQRGIVPYPYSGEAGVAGFAIADAARAGSTSFLVELMDQIIPLSDIESVILPRFLPMMEVLSQECTRTHALSYKDDFESGDFSQWSGTYTTQGETDAVTRALPYRGNYSARFTSNGTGGFEGAYCYESVSPSSKLDASGYFYLSQSGTTELESRLYLIEFYAGGSSVAIAGWRRTEGVIRWNLMVRDTAGWSAPVYSSTSPSPNKWYSLELYWSKNATGGQSRLYVDGKLVCNIRDNNTTASGNIDQVHFGLTEAYNCTASVIYVDSCHISESPTWDPNQDGLVDMRDLAIVAKAVLSTSGSPNWNPAADTNTDGTVDMKDVANAAIHFGEQYT